MIELRLQNQKRHRKNYIRKDYKMIDFDKWEAMKQAVKEVRQVDDTSDKAAKVNEMMQVVDETGRVVESGNLQELHDTILYMIDNDRGY